MRLISIFLLLQRLTAPDPAQMENAPDLGYRPVPHGMQIPADLEMGAPSSVDWTAENTLLVFNRGPNPLMEFEADGTFVRSWGQGLYDRPHGMRLDSSGNIWTTDVRGHTVTKMNPAGEVLMTLGVRGQPGEWNDATNTYLLEEPTDLYIGPRDEIFVIVSHGRPVPRVLRFDSTGKLITQWGRQGSGPGEFDTPHSIVVDDQGMVYVADRANHRVQIFDSDGTYIKEWAYKGWPCGLYIAPDRRLFLLSGFSGEILLLDKETGKALGANGQAGPGLGEFGEAHYMVMNPQGDLYIADTVSSRLHKFVKE